MPPQSIHSFVYNEQMTTPLASLGSLDANHSIDGKPHTLTIINARLPYIDKDLSLVYRIECRGGRVHEVSLLQTPTTTREFNLPGQYELDVDGSIVLPSLCHSHIHLDKCFILERCKIVTGQFNEALEVTGQAKAAFPLDPGDLYSRGARLIRESVQCGVTSMRSHVEVDKIVGFSCLNVAQELQSDFRKVCDVQIAAFAQEPLFDAPDDSLPGLNFVLLQEALKRDGVNVIGSAPYVEATLEQAKMNIALIMTTAHKNGVHVDFHLDYNLDPLSEPLIYEVISRAKKIGWAINGPTCHRITIGHATRLQVFSREEWRQLAEAIKDLPITFVGLPQSDIYMQGRKDYEKPLGAPRSTLRVPYLLNNYGIDVAMSVNNVENAFTPQGSMDPLTLCSLGVALFQTAAPSDIETLVRSVSLTSKLAIGLNESNETHLFPVSGDPADFVVLHGAQSLSSAALNPPYDRTTIRGGIVVARRLSSNWLLKD